MNLYKQIVLSRRQCTNYISKSNVHYLKIEEFPTKDALFENIIQNIIYKDDNIIAFNKPINSPMHAITYEMLTNRNSVQNPLWSLACIKKNLLIRLKLNFLEEIFSQNHYNSGVIVFALSEKVKKIYSNYFKSSRCQLLSPATYTSLSLGKFEKCKGHSQLAISQQKINNIIMSVAVKETRSGRVNRTISCPRIDYQVVDEFDVPDDFVSLVEMKPTSTKWDSLRMFCVNELCPIFYDGVYGGRVQNILDNRILISPQKAKINSLEISENLLHILGIDDSHKFEMPLHLHCSQLQLPVIYGTENIKLSMKDPITIKADIPHYFMETISRLKDFKNNPETKRNAI